MSHPSSDSDRGPRGSHGRRRHGLALLVGLAVLAAGTGLLLVDQRVPQLLTGQETGSATTGPQPEDAGAASATATAPQPSEDTEAPGSGSGEGDGGGGGEASPADSPTAAPPEEQTGGQPEDGDSPTPRNSPSDGELPAVMSSVEEEVDEAEGDLETVPGKSEPAGTGPRMRYTVEVEKGLPGDAADFAAAVEQILADKRGWRGEDGVSMQRVDKGGADFTVALAAPETVDRLCAPLQTMGRVSCTKGDRAIINQNRWVSGVEHFDGDLRTYRIYVINHEVGHALGRGHVSCPGRGEPAPVMQQQTFGLQGCEPNGWVQQD